MSSLYKRILFAIIAIPLALLIFYIGGVMFACVVAVISSLALSEFYNIAKIKGYPTFKAFGVSVGVIPIALFQLDLSINVNSLAYVVFSLAFCVVTLMLFLFSNRNNPTTGIATTFMGFVYISLAFVALVYLRNMDFGQIEDFGLIITILIFCAIWICDSAAFFIGSKFGKHKLMPSVSPKKSVEGAVAGFVFTVVLFSLASYLLMPEFNTSYAIILGIVLGVCGQIGDLIESKIKRDADIKDSSNLIPGHGGVLDRFDSIIFIAPIVVVMLLCFKGL